MKAFVDYMSSPEGLTFIASIVGFLWVQLMASKAGASILRWVEEWRMQRLVSFAHRNVMRVYHDYVRELKGLQDGKMTLEQKRKALNLAVNGTIVDLKAELPGFLIGAIKDDIPHIIERIITRNKGDAKGPLAVSVEPLSDVELD